MHHSTLVVDLDHTLIDTDLLQKSLYLLALRRPIDLLRVPFWLSKGKGHLKHQLVKRITIDVETLPYNKKVLDYINQRKQTGDRIILATASHQHYANDVADFLGCFDQVFATTKELNLSSQHKADYLTDVFGHQQFDYIGDHRRDLPVWQASYLAILVNTTTAVERKTARLKLNVLKL